MDKKTTATSIALQTEEKEPGNATEPPQKTRTVPSIWFWLCIVVLVVALIIGGISSVIGLWLKNVQVGTTPDATPVPTTTLQVKRTAPYAGLNFTVVSAQYATYFNDDNIRPGPATVRLNLQVTNTSGDPAKIIYYDNARLLVPQVQPIAPANVSLSAGPKPGKSESGWLDFAVQKDVSLDTLSLQLGSTTMSEALVTIPFKGNFDGSRYANKVHPQNAEFTYDFNGHFLNYHLTSLETRYSYQGSQSKVGQQFYVFNFTVENTEAADITPGFGFDYVRMVVNGYSQPPVDNSLPNTFKAGGHGSSGHVVFTGPANMHAFTISFLSQNGSAPQNFDVHI